MSDAEKAALPFWKQVLRGFAPFVFQVEEISGVLAALAACAIVAAG